MPKVENRGIIKGAITRYILAHPTATVDGIAESVGCGRALVKRVKAELKQSAIKYQEQDRKAIVADQLGKLDHIEAESLEAFERSKKPQVEARVQESTGGPNGPTTSTTKIRRETHGDPRFLEVALRANNERSKILGLIEHKLSIKVETEQITRAVGDVVYAVLGDVDVLQGVAAGRLTGIDVADMVMDQLVARLADEAGIVVETPALQIEPDERESA